MEAEINELNKILTTIDSVYRDAAAKLGVTDTEMNILYVIHWEGGSCNQSCLYKKTGVTRSTINSSLHKMQERGEIELVRGEGRNVRVVLTESGKALSGKTASVIVGFEEDIFGSWPQQDRQNFLQLNRRYLEQLKGKVSEL